MNAPPQPSFLASQVWEKDHMDLYTRDYHVERDFHVINKNTQNN